MSGLEPAVVALAVLSCLTLVGLAALLVQVRGLRRGLASEPIRAPSRAPSREPSRKPSREPSREVRTVRQPVESDAGVRFLPSVVAETSLSRERGQVSAPSSQELVQPLVRVAAVAHGVRCALAPANRDRIRALVRRDIRRRHKLRLRAARRAARVVPIDADS